MAINAKTYIPTLTSWVRADELKPGDYVYGPDGLPKQIKTVQQYTPTEMYEVDLGSGLSVQGDKHLSFELETYNYRETDCKRKNKRRTSATLKKESIMTLLSKGLKHKVKDRNEYSIPTTKPIQYRYEDLPIPPFIIGYWYGGTNRQSRLYAPGDKLEIVRNKLLDLGYVCKVIAKKHLQTTPNIIKTLRLHYGEIPNHIPPEYLFGSVEQRLELLRGFLLARNKSYDPRKDFYYVNSQKAGLISRIQGVCESLGMRTTIFYTPTGKAHQMRFRTDLDLMHKRKPKPGIKGHTRRFVYKITEIEPGPCVHIETEGTFLAGEGYIAIC